MKATSGASGPFTCPVCGYPELSEPPVDLTGSPTYSICPSCGVQFGADDVDRTHAELRHDWLARGGVWWSPNQPPPAAFSAEAQLRAAGLLDKPN